MFSICMCMYVRMELFRSRLLHLRKMCAQWSYSAAAYLRIHDVFLLFSPTRETASFLEQTLAVYRDSIENFLFFFTSASLTLQREQKYDMGISHFFRILLFTILLFKCLGNKNKNHLF